MDEIHFIKNPSAQRTIAEGVAIGDPGLKGEWILDILRENGGMGVTPADDEIATAQRLLAQTEGVWAGPTGSIAIAGVAKLAREGKLDRNARIVCIVSETGLKGQYPPLERAATPTDVNTWQKIIDQHRHKQHAHF